MICKEIRHPKMKKMPSEQGFRPAHAACLCKESRQLGLFVRKSSRLRPRGQCKLIDTHAANVSATAMLCCRVPSQAARNPGRWARRLLFGTKNGGPWGPPRLPKAWIDLRALAAAPGEPAQTDKGRADERQRRGLWRGDARDKVGLQDRGQPVGLIIPISGNLWT